VLGDERLELRDQRPLAPERELGLDALLPRDQTQLLEPLDVDARKQLELEVRERPRHRPSPSRSTLAARPASPCSSARRPSASSLSKRCRSRSPGSTCKVPGRAREQDRVGAERVMQPRHVDLDGVARRHRRVLGPQLLDQAIAGHDPVGLQQQDGQQRALLRSTERKPVPLSSEPRADRGCGSRCVAWSCELLTITVA
jgi:hypothetical protein